ncbi:pentatricopeptide repeat-containing protein At2g37320 [Fagus crenata]
MALFVKAVTKNKLSHTFQTLSHPKPFTSHKWKHTPQNKRRLDKALRVLDIITPKPSVTTTRQTHLRLVQNILPTDGFTASNTNVGIANVFDEMPEAYSSNNLIPKHSLRRDGLGVDVNVLSHAVSSCGSMRNLRGGIQYHCSAVRTGFIDNVYVGSSLVSLYSKCAELGNA